MIAHPINSLFFFLSWSVPTEIMIDEADSPIIPLHDLHVRISATDSDATGAGDFRITICTKVCVHYSTNLYPPEYCAMAGDNSSVHCNFFFFFSFFLQK